MSIRHRIALADDHRIVRDGLRALLLAEPDLELAGEAEDARVARSNHVPNRSGRPCQAILSDDAVGCGAPDAGWHLKLSGHGSGHS